MAEKMIYFKENGDERGKLVAIEGFKDVPFDIKRIFYIYGSDNNIIRGHHANRKSEFVLINVRGSSKVKILDGKTEKVYELNQPNVGIYIPSMLWKDMYDFSEDSILLVLASEYYDSGEYIKDLDEYMKEMNDNGLLL